MGQVSDEDLAAMKIIVADLEAGVSRTPTERELAILEAHSEALETEARRMGFRSFAQAEGERRTPTMRTVLKLLHRLERRFGLEVESEDTQRLRVRLENARRRCGSPAPSQECLAGLRGMTIPQILNSGRQPAVALHS
jgi:hypothetical protein